MENLEVEITVYQTSWGSWHYHVDKTNGRRLYSDCGSLVSWEPWGRRSAIRSARRAAKKYLRKQERGDRTYHETVTLSGQPSRAELETRIAELEIELNITK